MANATSHPTCRTCGGALIIRNTQRKASQLTQPYYYTGYYYCAQCNKIYHNERFKVVNSNFDLFTKHNLALSPVEVEIWTDGACSNNGRENAKASWAFVSGDYEASGLVEGKQTNNTAEALAIYHALLWSAEKKYKIVKIYSDSQITLHNLVKPYEKIKENQGIFQKIHEVITDNNLQVVYEKVLGHSGDTNNDRADKLANGLVGIK